MGSTSFELEMHFNLIVFHIKKQVTVYFLDEVLKTQTFLYLLSTGTS